MRAENDNDPFARLPLFASDAAIAEAIVGKEAAPRWLKERLPTISEKPGFPQIDAFHGGRAVPLVRVFYQSYLGITVGSGGMPDRGEGEWKGRKQ
ncbi:hypothetical protein [Phyllobacterium bourgognense]|uniref:Uncharacterized protein n=1 Tax=Phyllobacterium bourgognense TaxID=314236 RepID=A0A368YL28_9HYPH|nr:hypothetical protein [Phyllobacterium bourgognense]RCW80943.1 hypothetical protein C7476_112100 [Phyllobacterium bourgognense]